MFESHLPARIRERSGLLAALGSSYRFVISGDEGGAWLLRRGGAAFEVISDGAGSDAATTVGMNSPDLL